MRMRQETFKKSYYIPVFGKSIEIRRNQDIDEDGVLGKELLAQYAEDCILDGETKSLMERVASGALASGTVAVEYTIASLKALTVAKPQVWVSGYYTKGDGAFGSNIFEWDSTSTEDDNGGTIIKLSSVATGRYKLKYSGVVTPEMFGAIGDGIINDTVAIINLTKINKEVICSGNKIYKITGSENIEIRNNFNFNGSSFYPVDFTGEILIDNTIQETIELVSGDEFFDDLITNGGIVNRGSRVLPLLDDRYSGYYFIIETNEDFYSYRGTIKKRKFFTVLKREMQSDSPLDYDLDCSKITNLKLIKINPKRLYVKNINIIEDSIENYNLIHIIGTNIEYSNTFFIKQGINQLNPYSRLVVTDSCYIDIINIQTNTPILTTNKEYSYTLTMSNSYEVYINKMNSDGEGWGSVGNNDCSRVIFDNCRLNRIDFHNPFREYLKIINSTIGDWGVSVSGIGDLIIDNCEFLAKDGIVAALIGIRSDVGFVDGDLRMTNIKYSGGSTRSYNIISASLNADSGVTLGSAIQQRLFKNIIIDNFIDDTNSTRSYNILGVTTPDVFIAPESIDINNFKTKTPSISIQLNLDDLLSNQNLGISGVLPNYYPYSTILNIKGCNFNSYYFTGRGINHFVSVNIDTCTGGTLNPASFFIQSMGRYDLNKCSIKTMSTTYNSITAVDYLDIRITNSLINNPSATILSYDNTKDQEVRLLNNTIIYRESTQPSQVANCTDLGNKIINRL